MSIYDDVMDCMADRQPHTVPDMAKELGHQRTNVDHAVRIALKYKCVERCGETRRNGQRTILWRMVRMTDDTLVLTFPKGKTKETTFKGMPFIQVDTGMTAEQFILALMKFQAGGMKGGAIIKEDERMPECNEGFFSCSWCGGQEFTSYAQTAPRDRSRPWPYEYRCTNCGSTMRLIYREAGE